MEAGDLACHDVFPVTAPTSATRVGYKVPDPYAPTSNMDVNILLSESNSYKGGSYINICVVLIKEVFDI